MSTKLIGNAVVGQSGGPTAAINATLAGVIMGVKENVHDGSIKTLYGMRNGVEGLLEERLVDLTEYFADDALITKLENTPAAALGSCRKKLPKVHEGVRKAPFHIQKVRHKIFLLYWRKRFYGYGGEAI